MRIRHRAAVQGYTALARLLVDSGARLNVRDRVANTPLHLACEEGHGDTALLLIERGAQTDLVNADEKTPLDLASKEVRRFVEKSLDELSKETF